MKLTKHLRSGHFVRRASRRFGRSSGATRRSVLRLAQQPSSHQIQVRQCTRHEQSMRVFLQTPVARLGKGMIGENDSSIALSPDGSVLAVATTIGIWLYDVHTRSVFAKLIIGHFRFSDNQKVYHPSLMILYARMTTSSYRRKRRCSQWWT